MSLDIHLFAKPKITDGKVDISSIRPEDVAHMNWLRNPYGLCNWAENNFNATFAKSDTELWYVINHWNYEKSPEVNRKLFKSVVDGYWKVLQKIDKGYFFFNVYEYIQFIEPNLDLLPKEYLQIMDSKRIKGFNHALLNQIGIPMEYFTLEKFNLNFEKGETPLEHYKKWFFELVEFAEKLQDENLLFYCSN